mmetsp:Transcript_36684/g.92234  ORF Transcript_36684/g.92234 Transcript_36684/m.92234 type:complete len:118 (+) Transcript_36684:1498-1851(+)
MNERHKAKTTKHLQAYATRGLCFTPLVASTYGVLHPEFLRLLWILAGAHDGDLEPGRCARSRTLTPATTSSSSSAHASPLPPPLPPRCAPRASTTTPQIPHSPATPRSTGFRSALFL